MKRRARTSGCRTQGEKKSEGRKNIGISYMTDHKRSTNAQGTRKTAADGRHQHPQNNTAPTERRPSIRRHGGKRRVARSIRGRPAKSCTQVRTCPAQLTQPPRTTHLPLIMHKSVLRHKNCAEGAGYAPPRIGPGLELNCGTTRAHTNSSNRTLAQPQMRGAGAARAT